MREPTIITTKTRNEKLTELILENKREYLLSETVEETLIQMNQVRALFVEWGSRSKVVEKLVEAGMKLRTAWQYVDITPRLFATVPQELSRDFWVDIHFEKIEKTYRLAEVAGDHKAMALCDRNRAVAIEKFTGDNKAIDQSKLRLPDVITAFHPEWFPEIPPIGSQEYEMLLMQFKKRKDRIDKMQIIDIDFEEQYESNNDGAE